MTARCCRALGADVGKLYTLMFMAGSFLAGLGGALVTPVRSIVPGMDVDIIVEAFIVVVIGGLGSFWGTFLGAIIFGQVLAFGILVLPGFSIFAVFVLMALVLVVRPGGPARPAGEAVKRDGHAPAHSLGRARIRRRGCVPWLGSRFYTFLATDIAILALFAASLNLLLGYTGLVSFGHAAYFGDRRLHLRDPDEDLRHAVRLGARCGAVNAALLRARVRRSSACARRASTSRC